LRLYLSIPLRYPEFFVSAREDAEALLTVDVVKVK